MTSKQFEVFQKISFSSAVTVACVSPLHASRSENTIPDCLAFDQRCRVFFHWAESMIKGLLLQLAGSCAFFHPPQASSHKHVGQTTADMTAGSDLCSTVMIAPSPQAFSSFRRWWPCVYVLETWLSQMPGWGWYDTQRAICTPPIRSLYCSMNETSSNMYSSYLLCFPVSTLPQKNCRTHFIMLIYHIHAWERVLFPLQPPSLARVSPHPLPAISGANLKLRYYESCTQRVGGRFRTSTPSINSPMGPTSWLNRPVPMPDNLSSKANLRSN